MKLIEYFKTFLDGQVNLDEARLGRLHSSVEAVTGFLEGCETFRDSFIDTIPQGSLAHKTIIRPVRPGDEFDADLLLYLEEFEGWEPADYVEQLYAAFRTSHIYREKVRRRSRCVVVDYAGDFHMDVVPYLDRHGAKYITNRKENRFELTDPEGYNAWLDEKNRVAGRNLVRVIRLLKYLRDYKGTFAIKSVVLNVLLGEQVNPAALLADPGCYADVPTTLRTVLLRLRDYLSARPFLPAIMDPSGTGESFSDRWDQQGYASFRTAMIRYAEWIDDAWREADRALSVEKWQRVFGDAFLPPPARAASQAMVKAAAPAELVKYTNTEQNLVRDLGIPFQINPRYAFRITGRVTKDGSMGAYYLRDRGNKVRRRRRIRFTVEQCGVPPPFTIYWKVVNRGPEAKANDSIRGQIEAGGREWRILETSSFTGPHYVEAYAVKDGVCVATDRQDVIII